MKRIIASIDQALNGITMYRLLFYGLLGIAIVAVGFGFGGVLPYSGLHLLVSLLVLLLVGYVVNACFALIWNTPSNFESTFITALILFFIFPPYSVSTDLLYLAIAIVIATASKYLITWRGKLIFNPAVVAAVALTVPSIYPALWWVATPALLPLVLLLGLCVVRKIRRFQMVSLFIGVALATMLTLAFSRDQPLGEAYINAFASWPLVFFGTIMLTEPATSPIRRRWYLVYAGLVGVLFASQAHIGTISTNPENVLLLGNLLAFFVNPGYRLTMKLVKKTKLSENVYDYAFAPNRPIAFKPGQYMEWTLGLPASQIDIRGNRRTFTIASAPTEKEVHVGVKFYEPGSTYKAALRRMEPGDQIAASHLAGEFTLPRNTNQKLLFVAGGIGITPFRSMLKYLTDTEQTRDIVLIYATASEAEVSYKDVLTAAQKHGLQLVILHDKPTDEVLGAAIPDITERTAYISGPLPMVTFYKTWLRGKGLKRRHIKTDYFSGY